MIVSGKWKIQLNCRDVFITWKCRFLGHGNQVLMNPSKPSVGAGRPLKFEALTRSWSKGGKECRHLQRICKEPRSFRKGHVCMKSRKKHWSPSYWYLARGIFLSDIVDYICYDLLIGLHKSQESGASKSFSTILYSFTLKWVGTTKHCFIQHSCFWDAILTSQQTSGKKTCT